MQHQTRPPFHILYGFSITRPWWRAVATNGVCHWDVHIPTIQIPVLAGLDMVMTYCYDAIQNHAMLCLSTYLQHQRHGNATFEWLYINITAGVAAESGPLGQLRPRKDPAPFPAGLLVYDRFVNISTSAAN